MYSLVYTKKAVNDIPKLKSAKLDRITQNLLEILKENPYATPPSYEKLQGKLQKAYSRRINNKHRLVYEILEEKKVVKIISMWTHYEF